MPNEIDLLHPDDLADLAYHEAVDDMHHHDPAISSPALAALGRTIPPPPFELGETVYMSSERAAKRGFDPNTRLIVYGMEFVPWHFKEGGFWDYRVRVDDNSPGHLFMHTDLFSTPDLTQPIEDADDLPF